jgi:hypothetical protein
VTSRRRTSTPRSAAICATDRAVIPSRIEAADDGVEISPSRTTNTFSPEPSDTRPCSSSMIASS